MMYSAVSSSPVSLERQSPLSAIVPLDEQHFEKDNDKERGAAALTDTAMLECTLDESCRKDPLAEVVTTVQSVRSGQTDLHSGSDDDVWLADSSDSRSVNALHSGSDDDVWLGDSSDSCSVNALHSESDADSRTDSSTVDGNERAIVHRAFSGATPAASSPSDTHLASTSARPIDRSLPPRRTAAQIDSPSNFCAGDRVFIHGGSYKGETGTVTHLTAKKVGVRIDGLDVKPRCLAPDNVTLQVSGEESEVSAPPSPLHRCSQQSRKTGRQSGRVGAVDQVPNLVPVLDDEISLGGGSLGDMNDGINGGATVYNACQDLTTLPNQALAMSNLALDTSQHTHENATETEAQHTGKWKAGDTVDIIGGKYKGETGTFVKFTAAKVQVELLVDDKPTVRCLARKSVTRRVDGEQGTREGMENNARAEEPNETPTSSQPRTTRSQSRGTVARKGNPRLESRAVPRESL
jgi:ribosomal protein L24